MLHWSYTPEQKEELKMALAAGVPKATILTYFYPEVTAEKMSLSNEAVNYRIGMEVMLYCRYAIYKYFMKRMLSYENNTRVN